MSAPACERGAKVTRHSVIPFRPKRDSGASAPNSSHPLHRMSAYAAGRRAPPSESAYDMMRFAAGVWPCAGARPRVCLNPVLQTCTREPPRLRRARPDPSTACDFLVCMQPRRAGAVPALPWQRDGAVGRGRAGAPCGRGQRRSPTAGPDRGGEGGAGGQNQREEFSGVGAAPRPRGRKLWRFRR